MLTQIDSQLPLNKSIHHMRVRSEILRFTDGLKRFRYNKRTKLPCIYNQRRRYKFSMEGGPIFLNVILQ